MEYIPITFNLEDEEELQKIETMNKLEKDSLGSAKWIKPAGRWGPKQTIAHVILVMHSPEEANKLIQKGLKVEGKKVYVCKAYQDTRCCLKC